MMFVCLSSCLSTPISRKPHNRTSPNFCACCLWHGWDFLWRRLDTLCTSGFTNGIILSYHWAKGPQSSTTLFRRVRQVADVVVPVGCQTTTAFGWVCQSVTLGAKSAIYNCLRHVSKTKIVRILCLSFVFVHKNAITATNVINHILHQIFST